MCLSQEKYYPYFRLLLIVAAGFFAYSNTFNNPFIFDDAPNIINNPAVRSFNAATLGSRRAFGIFTFQINYFLSGANVFSYHLVNLLVHISAALLVYAMLAQLFKTPYWRRCSAAPGAELPIPFFTALVFVAHPLQPQAVTYIVQRFASLATLLYILAVVCYLRGRICQQEARLSIVRISGWFALMALSGLLAIFTKEIAYTLPLALVAVELLFFDVSRAKIVKLSLVAVALFMAILARFLTAGTQLSDIISRLDETTKVQTIVSRWDYLLTQFRVICTYLRLLFLPVNQSIDHNYSVSHSLMEWRVALAFLLLASILLLSLWLIRVSGSGNAHLRLIAFGILWFFLTLSIESSFLPIIDLIFEHRGYLPSVGFFLATVTLVLSFAWARETLLARQRAVTVLLLLAMLLTAATWKRNLVWADEARLWADAVTKNPYSSRAWNNLGGVLIIRKDGDKALRALIRSVELDSSRADALNNIGMALDLMGAYRDRFNRTKEMFSDPQSVQGETVNRWLGDVYNNLGLAYELTGNLPKAAENYRNAIGYYPAQGLAYYNLGIVSAAMKDYGKYAEQLQILMMFNPPLAERLQLRVGNNVLR
ncbi:MAG: tetratricopeptide repeat protein [Geobacter sp.]|nr:tetratricopeptide repeat protein [Geobacter sp.]